MARDPQPGLVKTRLAARIGAQAACRLYRAFVLDLAERLDATAYPVTWAFTPADAPFERMLAGRRCLPQVEGDLGAKLDAAIRACLRVEPRPVLVIGADAPHVPLTALEEAEESLAAGHDLVLGPATDGGYYLLGVRAPAPMLLTGMPWGTEVVLAETLERARAGGLGTHLLPPLGDVDTWDDARRLHAEHAGDQTLPRTLAVLDELVRSGAG